VSDIRSERKFVREQYRTKDNLQIRIETHVLYSQPKVEFHDWILDHVDWSGYETVLDVGCGSGMYAGPVGQRCHRYIAADLSLGMLQSLAHPVQDKVNVDAAGVPFRSESLDVVLANHMLYHVPELKKAVREVYRVLKPGGILVAATNSSSYMPELLEIQHRLASKFGVDSDRRWSNPGNVTQSFSLENGQEVLEPTFAHIERFDLPGALVFDESEPLIAYLGSMRERYEHMYAPGITWEDVSDALRAYLDKHIAIHREFRVHKLAGVFVCRKEY
jgi:SAM-dependent methyltransferase